MKKALFACVVFFWLAAQSYAVDMWMDVDTALSEVPVNIYPLTDDSDFKSREESVAYNAAGLELLWHFTTSAGATSVTAVTPTTGGAYDWAHQDGGMYTIEIPATDPGSGTIWNDTEGFGYFTGYATGILPWRGPIIGFRDSDLNDKLIDSAWSATRGLAGTSLPDAAADAAGGLPISDDGGLDMDEILVSAQAMDTNGEIATAVWNAATGSYGGAGTYGQAVEDVLVDTGTTLQGELDGIQADTEDLQAQIGTDGDGLTAVPWNAAWDAEVESEVDDSIGGGTGTALTALPYNAAWDAEIQSECTDALNAYDPPTAAELTTAIGNVSVDEIQASALADLFNTDSGTDYASSVAGSVVKEIADNAGGSSLTAEDIVDEWEAQSQADPTGFHVNVMEIESTDATNQLDSHDGDPATEAEVEALLDALEAHGDAAWTTY